MNDAGLMRARQAAGDLRGKADGFRRRDYSSLEAFLEGFTVAERHREENTAVRQLLDVVDRADVRMIERRGRARFGEQAGVWRPRHGQAAWAGT